MAIPLYYLPENVENGKWSQETLKEGDDETFTSSPLRSWLNFYMKFSSYN